MRTMRALFLLGICSLQVGASAQEDVTFREDLTYQIPTLNSFDTYIGYKNYVPNGGFNTRFYDGISVCDQFDYCDGWATSWNCQGSSGSPVILWDPDDNWPYSARFYCATLPSQHPSYGLIGYGHMRVDLHRTTNTNTDLRNYMAFRLKKPLVVGAQYTFEMSVVADQIAPTSPTAPWLDRIGACVLHDLPVVTQAGTPLDSLTPLFSTPPGEPVKDTGLVVSGTFIGNGERYLVIGVFGPLDSITFSDAPVVNSHSYYHFDRVKIYRPDCPNGTTDIIDSVETQCVGVQVNVDPVNVPSPVQWWMDGVPLPDTTDGIDAIVPDHDVYIQVVGDTGTCSDTAHFVLEARRIDVPIADDFLYCDSAVVIDEEPVYHHVPSPNTVYVEWREVGGGQVDVTSPDVAVTIPDTGWYLVHLQFNTCHQRDTFYIGPNIELLDTNAFGDPYLLMETGEEHCIDLADGHAMLHDLGYPANLSYDWYDSPSAGINSNSVQGLTEGPYTVKVWDDQQRCSFYTANIDLLLDGCGTAQGNVYEDSDLDCLPTVGEEPIGYATVRAQPGDYVASTSPTGDYMLFLSPGDYTLTRMYDPLVGNVCGYGAAISLAAGGSMATTDFADSVHVPIQDVAIVELWHEAFMVGTDRYVNIRVRNRGEVDGEIQLRVLVTSPAVAIQTGQLPGFVGTSGDTVLVDGGWLAAGDEEVFSIPVLVVGDTYYINSVAHIFAKVDPLPSEDPVVDNSWSQDATIIGPFDPNFKEVSPGGEDFTHLIDTAERVFTYTVHFQNVGNAPAAHVQIQDPLDPLLQAGTLTVLHASHTMNAFTYNGVAYFDFPSIMLPDSASDPEGSQGEVIYRMRAVDAAGTGDTIANTAYIHFDQNPPIVTNTCLSIYSDLPTAVAPARPQGAAGLLVVPNPTNGTFVLQGLPERVPAVRYDVLDITGRVALQGSWSPAMHVRATMLPAGVYTVRLLDGHHGILGSARLIKQ